MNTLSTIAENLHMQDNRITSDPVFWVEENIYIHCGAAGTWRYIPKHPFFTEQGAKDYIKINGHNLREPRIYVESGHRNYEWREVRAHLMSLRGEGWKS